VLKNEKIRSSTRLHLIPKRWALPVARGKLSRTTGRHEVVMSVPLDASCRVQFMASSIQGRGQIWGATALSANSISNAAHFMLATLNVIDVERGATWG